MKESRTEANKKKYAALSALNWIYSVGMAAVIALLVFTVWFTGIKISDGGMQPTLYKGDIILFDKLAKHAAMPRRGDAYAFESGGVAVGRIVGLPGDSVAIRQGTVYIEGFRLDESKYASACDWNMDELTLAKGEFFILPDDRENAVLDAELMTVEFDRLIGRAAVRVSPLSMACVFICR